MRPISNSPLKANPNPAQGFLSRNPSAASTKFATATRDPRGRGSAIESGTADARGRSRSPRDDNFNLTELTVARKLFSKSPGPTSPVRRVFNSDFTGRTFSEREKALEVIAMGGEPPALPDRTLSEVPWKQGKSKNSKDGGGWEDEEDIIVRPANFPSSPTKTASMVMDSRALETKDIAPCVPKAMGSCSGSSTVSTDSSGIEYPSVPHYELIIWRTFPTRKSSPGQEVAQPTRKCSFPITKELAQRLAEGHKIDFLTAVNKFISTQGPGIPITSDPSFTLPVTTQADSSSFPVEFLDLAEQQFADIIDEVVSYQVQGYGRWSVDGMTRRVVKPEGGRMSSLGPYLEALVVITLESCGNRWVGLPGFDAEGKLKNISRKEISEAKDQVDAGRLQQYLPLTSARITSRSSTALDAGKQEKVTPANKATRGGVSSDIKSPSKLPATLPAAQLSSSPDMADNEETTGDEDMSMINTDILESVFSKMKPSQIPSPSSRTVGGHEVHPRFPIGRIRLSTTTTPFLVPTPAHHSGHTSKASPPDSEPHTANWKAYTPVAPESPNAVKVNASLNTPTSKFKKRLPAVAPTGDITSSDDRDDDNATPKPKHSTHAGPWASQNVSNKSDYTPHVPDSSTLRRDVLVKGTLEAGKTYVSSRNPSNPLPGTLMSPGFLESQPTLRMVAPTPPPKASIYLATQSPAHGDPKPLNSRHKKPGASTSGVSATTPATAGPKSSFTFRPKTSTLETSTITSATATTTQLTCRTTHNHKPPTQSLQNLAQLVSGETAYTRRRWEESTASTLNKERAPSPIKSRPNSPIKRSNTGSIKRTESPVKTILGKSTSQRALGLGQPTAASLARTTSIRSMGSANMNTSFGLRPKSRATGDGSQTSLGERPKSRGAGALAGRGNVASLRHEGKTRGVLKANDEGKEAQDAGYFHTRTTKF